MRLPSILGKKTQPRSNEPERVSTTAGDEGSTKVSPEDANSTITCDEAKFNLAIGLSSILDQLGSKRRDQGDNSGA